MLRALILELHGTLLDDEAPRLRVLRELAAENGLAASPLIDGRTAAQDDRHLLRWIWRANGASLSAEAARRLLAEKAERMIALRPSFHPGAKELVEGAARSLAVAITARSSRREAEVALKEAGLFRRLTAFVSGENLLRPRPSAEALGEALAKMNAVLSRFGGEPIGPRSVLVIDHTEAGAAAAREAGMRSVLVGGSEGAADARVARIGELDLALLRKELF